MPYDYDPDALLKAESDIRSRLEGQPVDLEVERAVSNIYRAATVVSRTAEREVLTEEGLSWSGFAVLWVLWVWGEMDSSRLAAELGLTLGTLTGVRKGLETQGLVKIRRTNRDRRRMHTSLTPEGEEVIQRVFPRFNQRAGAMLGGLTGPQINELATLLQAVIVQPNTPHEPN